MNAFREEDNNYACNGGLEMQRRPFQRQVNYNKFIVRLGSYNSTPCNLLKKYDLAFGGFYRQDDYLSACPSCTLELHTAAPHTVPLREHITLSPECSFVRNVIRNKFKHFRPIVSDILYEANWNEKKCGRPPIRDYKQLSSLEYVNDAKDLNVHEMISRLSQVKIRNSIHLTCILCVFCQKRERNVLTFPCQHLKACQFCLDLQTCCPDCDCDITSTVRVTF